MKKQLVNGLIAGFFAIISVAACSSKSAQTAENSDTTASPTVASSDKANLGSGSSGRGR